LAQREHFQLNGTDTVLTRKDVITNDANGRASKIKVYDGKGKSIASLSYSYDAKGNEVKMKASMKVILDADSTFSRQTAYTYDSLGRVAKKMVKSVKADKQKESILYAYTYNKEGKLESTTRYDEMGKMLGKEEIVYYSGRISQRKYYNSEGVLTENLAFRYRKFGASLDNNMY
jgi:YD repeat-containing protein